MSPRLSDSIVAEARLAANTALRELLNRIEELAPALSSDDLLLASSVVQAHGWARQQEEEQSAASLATYGSPHAALHALRRASELSERRTKVAEESRASRAHGAQQHEMTSNQELARWQAESNMLSTPRRGGEPRLRWSSLQQRYIEESGPEPYPSLWEVGAGDERRLVSTGTLADTAKHLMRQGYQPPARQGHCPPPREPREPLGRGRGTVPADERAMANMLAWHERAREQWASVPGDERVERERERGRAAWAREQWNLTRSAWGSPENSLRAAWEAEARREEETRQALEAEEEAARAAAEAQKRAESVDYCRVCGAYVGLHKHVDTARCVRCRGGVLGGQNGLRPDVVWRV